MAKSNELNFFNTPSYGILNINKEMPKNNSKLSYQTRISYFCSSSLIDKSISINNVKSDEKGSEYHPKELWKIGINFFMAIDPSILTKLEINENHSFIEQRVIETADCIMILFKKPK
jgi:hypothetical protein